MGKKILPPTLGAIITLFFDANHGNPPRRRKRYHMAEDRR